MHRIRLRVNGREHELAVEARRTLADMLRHDLGYTGTHLGCEHGICGACTVLVDGCPVRSCLMFGVQADGTEVSTVEGLADGDELSDLQQAFSDHHALQCGFCTPGLLMLAEAYLADRLAEPGPAERDGVTGAEGDGRAEAQEDGLTEAGADGLTEAEVRELVASNLCRCTGYQGIIEAVLATDRSRRATDSPADPP
jgi:carbon-monoxide dehydrogenase small subunit